MGSDFPLRMRFGGVWTCYFFDLKSVSADELFRHRPELVWKVDRHLPSRFVPHLVGAVS